MGLSDQKTVSNYFLLESASEAASGAVAGGGATGAAGAMGAAELITDRLLSMMR